MKFTTEESNELEWMLRRAMETIKTQSKEKIKNCQKLADRIFDEIARCNYVGNDENID